MTLHEILVANHVIWVLDSPFGNTTQDICRITGATYNGALPEAYQADAKTLADFVVPRQQALLCAHLTQKMKEARTEKEAA